MSSNSPVDEATARTFQVKLSEAIKWQVRPYAHHTDPSLLTELGERLRNKDILDLVDIAYFARRLNITIESLVRLD